ncbi:MAG: LCP family protein [Halanaerobiaceae bacterium]
MEKENSANTDNSKKIIIAISVAILLLLLGLYLYFYYPQVIPGVAGTQLNEKINVVIIGLDDQESVDEGGVAADSIIFAQLNTESNQLKLNHIVMDKKTYGESMEENEIQTLLEEIQTLSEINEDIDHYFTISYNGFINLVNNLNGITINRNEPLKIPDLDLDLKAGNNKLSGEEALNYARWYDYRNDITERIQRQQQIIKALLDKALNNKTILDVPEIFNTTVDTFNSVETNLDYQTISDLIEYYMNNDNPDISYDIIRQETEESSQNQ